jgi:hypothetical protein
MEKCSDKDKSEGFAYVFGISGQWKGRMDLTGSGFTHDKRLRILVSLETL